MNLSVQIPLGKIQNRHSINKIEHTNIDKYLTTEQKKRVAKLYREEAAKRTKYVIEPVWTIPDSVQLVKLDQSKPMPAPAPTETNVRRRPVIVIEVVPVTEEYRRNLHTIVS